MTIKVPMNSDTQGWVIVHPDGKFEVDYFNIINFKTKMDGYYER